MDRALEFAANHPFLVLALLAVLGALAFTEAMRHLRPWKELGSSDATTLINREDALVVDVGSPNDYADGHLIGARHIAAKQATADHDLLKQHKDRAILLYDRRNQLPPQVASRLAKAGFSKVHVLKGGLTAWLGDNLPVSRGTKKPRKSKKK